MKKVNRMNSVVLAHWAVGFLLFGLWVNSASADYPSFGIVRNVQTLPSQPVAGQPAIFRLFVDPCWNYLPGGSAEVTQPSVGAMVINLTVSVSPGFCFGNELRTRDVPFTAPAAGQYTVNVTGQGVHVEPPGQPFPFVIQPLQTPLQLTVLGGGAPAVVPVPIMSPLAIGLLGGVLALGGWFALRRRRA
jgi:hypothetical protein